MPRMTKDIQIMKIRRMLLKRGYRSDILDMEKLVKSKESFNSNYVRVLLEASKQKGWKG